MTKHVYELYIDVNNQWRYRVFSSNGRNVGSSGEGIKNFRDIFETVNNLKKPEDEVRIIPEAYSEKQFLTEKKEK
jgi:uncharacterized protein YegP (UPF0339 family)